jgi:RimJ/RimL family protein N-acetyltransferase
MRTELARTWPQFSLRLASGPIHLEVPTDDQLLAMAELAATPDGVLPAAHAHYVTWLQGRSPEDLRRTVLAEAWRHRDLSTRPGWTLDLGIVLQDGEIIGLQRISGFDAWPRRRVVGTSSWIARPWQRNGFGTLARVAVLDFAFTTLTATQAMSWVTPENVASRRICEGLGYHCVGGSPADDEPGALLELKYRLDAEDWRRSNAALPPATKVVGERELLQLLG